MTGHEAAPYQLLVDHLAAAASDAKETTFSNVSTIECPAKPSDYTCPKVLTNLSKEELKKKICEYDTVLTGGLNLIPDTDKAQTRCGAMKLEKVLAKSDEDAVELANKMAIVMGKDCEIQKLLASEQQAGKISGASNEQQQQQQLDQIHMLIKASIPTSTKFILADGANMDLLSASVISKDELASFMKQCPKVAAN